MNSVPNKTYKYLQKLNIITISRNLDKQICKATKSDIKSNPTMKFILDDIDNEALEWMGDLPFDRQITEEEILGVETWIKELSDNKTKYQDDESDNEAGEFEGETFEAEATTTSKPKDKF